MDDITALRRILERIDDAWTTGQTDPLRPLFHADMLIAGPGYHRFAVGRDACVESYREFCTNAKVLAYQPSHLEIRVWGDTAVASYSWSMTWQRTGDPVSDSGTDQFVFGRFRQDWLAVYRLVLFNRGPSIALSGA
jgi:hypothetical protein